MQGAPTLARSSSYYYLAARLIETGGNEQRETR